MNVFLDEIKTRHTDAMVIIMTAFATIDTAVEAMRKGAYDYITKPFLHDDIRMRLHRALELKRTRRGLKDAQTLMVHSEKLAALGQLAAGIVHEINMLIGSIQSNVDLLDRLLARIRAADPSLGSNKEGAVLQAMEIQRVATFLIHLVGAPPSISIRGCFLRGKRVAGSNMLVRGSLSSDLLSPQ